MSHAHHQHNTQHGCSHEGLITLDQALDLYLQHGKTLPEESKSLLNSQHQILSEDVLSPVALPLFTQSAVDGYALRQQDIDAGIRSFELIGEVRAGIEQHLQIQQGQALRIFTGGRLPDSCDTVARQEIISRHDNAIQLNSTIQKGTDIRYQGEELKQNTLLAKKGQPISVGLIASLSMAGVKNVKVFKQPRVAVVITGDEVSEDLSNDAKVFDANGPLIHSWLTSIGIKQFEIFHVVDEAAALSALLEKTFNQFDIVLTTGGVSVGDYDLIRPLSLKLGAQEVFWQVAQKPGKPLYFAKYQKADQQASYLLGLPGNPAAVFIGLYVHAQTLLNVIQGFSKPLPQWKTGLMTEQLKTDSREQLLRMQTHVDERGVLRLSRLPKQQSHMLSNLNTSNAIVRIQPDTAFNGENYLQFLAF